MFSVSLLIHYCFLQNLVCHVISRSMWIRLAFLVLGYRWFQLSLFSSTWSLLRFALPYMFALNWFQLQISVLEKSLYVVALTTSVYTKSFMTDGIDTLLGSYMKKRGIDLSSLASSLWEFMPAMVSTTLFLPARTTLLLVTTECVRKVHDLWQSLQVLRNYCTIRWVLIFFSHETLHSSYSVVTYVDDEFVSL
jgi:hypothetical protein